MFVPVFIDPAPRDFRRICVWALALLIGSGLCAEEQVDSQSLATKLGMATFETLGSNVFVWGMDYLAQQPYAQISPETWKQNLQGDFQWDDSAFLTNQILHPYQGSSYFNAARTNGLSFWQSVPFVAFGSLTWELFCETGLPSINDLITTTFGGIALGETSYRLANALVQRKPEGAQGVIREVAAGIINPVQSVNRLIFEKPTPPSAPGRPSYYRLDMETGGALASQGDEVDLDSVYTYLGFSFQYEDPYSDEVVFGPYDYFAFDFGVSLNLHNPTWDVFGQAVLYGHELYLGDSARALVGVFQHFDYLENFEYKFASNGAGVGFQLFVPVGESGSIELRTHLSGIALGGVDSSISKEEADRDYSLGSGGAVKNALVLTRDGLGQVTILYNHYLFHTLSGADTTNQVSFLLASLEVPITDALGIGTAFQWYDRYCDFQGDNATNYVGLLYVTHAL